MIDYVNKDLFYQDSVLKHWTITATKVVDNQTVTVATIRNEDLLYDSITLTEAISSSDGLVFGRCESSRFEFTVYNVISSLKGCELTVDIVLGDDTANPFRLGTYIVDSDKPTADRYHRKVIAYDRLSKLNEMDVKDWYAGLTFPITIKNFRDSFFTRVGITQETVVLPQDNIQIQKSLNEDESMSALSIIQAICELNGCFGHMRRDDTFQYKYVPIIVKALYPAEDLYPAENLYPADWIIDQQFEKKGWMSAEYEDYECKEIGGVVIMGENNEIAAYTSQTPENPLKIEGNFLTYDVDNATLTAMANNLYSKVAQRVYQPSKFKCLANPCLEVGDSYCYNTKDSVIASYILQRTMTGLQLLVDTYESDGDEDRSKQLSSISKQLQRLANKTEWDLDVERARITYLEAEDVVINGKLTAHQADITNLWASEAVISGSLTAAIGRISTIESDYITTVSFQAQNINANKITAGTLNVQRLNVTDVTDMVVNGLSTKNVSVIGLTVGGYFYVASQMVQWKHAAFNDGDGLPWSLDYLGKS